MFETLLICGYLGLFLVVLATLYLIIHIQRRGVERLQVQQQAWERAQEGHQRQWQENQEHYFSQIEEKLTAQVVTLASEKQAQEVQPPLPVEMPQPPEKTPAPPVSIEQEVARLPMVGDMPLPSKKQDSASLSEEHISQIFSLRGADLSGRDLSHRYLARADLRNTQLSNVNFFMADLSGADLSGANLAGADLSAANLTNTNLADANLAGANLLVADLNNTNLPGANLSNVRNLTREQIHTAIIDDTTLLASELIMSFSLPSDTDHINTRQPQVQPESVVS